VLSLLDVINTMTVPVEYGDAGGPVKVTDCTVATVPDV
jgi:hypothetical protein